VKALEARDLAALSWAELLGTVHEALEVPWLVWELRVRYFVRPMLAAARLRLALAVLGRADLFATLLFTGVETATLRANRALESLASRIRAESVLADFFARHEPGELRDALDADPTGRAFLRNLDAFLDAYGHRETGGTLQASRPTWKEAPEAVLGLLQGLARAEGRPQAPPAWEGARDDLLRHPLLRLPRLRAAFLDLLAAARRFPRLREDTRFEFMRALPPLRPALLELGRRLGPADGARVLDAPEDVFHLKLGELERIAWPPSSRSAVDLRALVARRKAKRAALASTPLVDPRLLARPEAGDADDALLRGIPGSPGVATGPVRIVRDGAQFGLLQPGEVLVAPYTNPAWTPLFERAAAVVVDSGGPASHAAIVAREYGIPAVMATADGTARLADGQRVRVDGAAGLVFGE
jgi:pyruvate,water dikinase